MGRATVAVIEYIQVQLKNVPNSNEFTWEEILVGLKGRMNIRDGPTGRMGHESTKMTLQEETYKER